MTRSVEIPQAAREKAAAELYGAMGGSVSQWLDIAPKIQDYYRELTDLMLSAALPYLAPAGDGGLREALTDLLAAVEASPCTFWACEGPDSEPQDMITCNPCRAVHEARKVLAAHPAASAVPQPVDREALERALLAVKLTDKPPAQIGKDLADAVLALLAGEQEQVEP